MVAQAEEELSRLQLTELQSLGVLGQGSSGVVRKMRHLPTGRLICLKVPSPRGRSTKPRNRCQSLSYFSFVISI